MPPPVPPLPPRPPGPPVTQASLRSRLGAPGDPARLKAIAELDDHCAQILALSPFAVVATSGADGSCDASPRGGPPGFIRMLSPTRVAWAELSGNRLFDGVQNVAENPHAALLVMVPGLGETLRIEGSARVSTDEADREATAIDGRLPWGALVVEVDKAFVHCGKAFKRSALWEPESWPSREELPRMGAVLRDHMAAAGPAGLAEAPPAAGDLAAELQEWYRQPPW